MTSVAICSKFDNTAPDRGELVRVIVKLTIRTLPHTIDNLPAFINRVCSLETPLDGPVSKSGGGATLVGPLWGTR